MIKVKEIFILMITLLLCLTLSACKCDITAYTATMMVTTNTSNKATLSFGSFKGTYRMHLQSNGDDQVYISYEATLKQGNIKVYCDYNGKKLNLFEIGYNDTKKGRTEVFKGKKTIHITIESDGKCKDGKFSFILERA